jgi:hypothetical protein
VLWPKVGLRGPACQAGRPSRVAGQPSFLAALTLGITDLLHRSPLTRVWNDFQKYAKPWPADPTLAQLGLDFVPHHSLMSYCLWLCLILYIMKICMDFSSYDAFLSSDVPEMGDQQNSWNSLVISTYLLYLEWNVDMLAVDICIYDRQHPSDKACATILWRGTRLELPVATGNDYVMPPSWNDER